MKSDFELDGLAEGEVLRELCRRVGETNRLLSSLLGAERAIFSVRTEPASSTSLLGTKANGYTCRECGEKCDTALALARHTKTHKKEGVTPA
jgi:hypothetical protein